MQFSLSVKILHAFWFLSALILSPSYKIRPSILKMSKNDNYYRFFLTSLIHRFGHNGEISTYFSMTRKFQRNSVTLFVRVFVEVAFLLKLTSFLEIRCFGHRRLPGRRGGGVEWFRTSFSPAGRVFSPDICSTDAITFNLIM